MLRRPLIIGFTGGSGSGKTTVVEMVADQLGKDLVSSLQQDSYYLDQSSIPSQERDKLNYDHPAALEIPLLASHLEQLIAGKSIRVPVYDYSTHARSAETVVFTPGEIVLLEGTLLLVDLRIRRLLDICFYIETPPDLRFLRRLQRDVLERGRTMESVIDQYLESVRPMHEKFVEPSKELADLVIPWNEQNVKSIQLIVEKIRSLQVLL